MSKEQWGNICGNSVNKFGLQMSTVGSLLIKGIYN